MILDLKLLKLSPISKISVNTDSLFIVFESYY